MEFSDELAGFEVGMAGVFCGTEIFEVETAVVFGGIEFGSGKEAE